MLGIKNIVVDRMTKVPIFMAVRFLVVRERLNLQHMEQSIVESPRDKAERERIEIQAHAEELAFVGDGQVRRRRT